MNAHPKPLEINNAGLVLLAPYFQLLFERLSLLFNKKFLHPEWQRKAAQALSFLSHDAHTLSTEYTLVHILCGLSAFDQGVFSAGLSIEEELTIDGMLSFAIRHWTVLSDSSLTSFRSNWLMRPGKLTELDDRWLLKIAVEPQDVLLLEYPVHFEHISLPWMQKMIEVKWI